MKKVIAGALLITGTYVAGAQNLSMGPVVGINHSWMTNTDQTRQFNPGLVAGGTITYSFASHWGVGGDFLYSMEGVKIKNSGAVTNTTICSKLDFIRLQPKLMFFGNDLGDRFRPTLYVGPSFGFMIGGNTKTEVSNKNSSATLTTIDKSTDLYNNFDFGVLVGTGFNYRISKATWLNFGMNYVNGLVDLSNSNETSSASRSVSVNMGVTFPLGTVPSK